MNRQCVKRISIFSGAILLFCGFAALSLHGQGDSRLEIKVIDHHSGHGVKSSVSLIEPNGQKLHLANTSAEGVADVQHTCIQGEQILATPLDLDYTESQTVDCGTPLTLDVSWGPGFSKLERIANKAHNNGKYAVAALAYNDLAARARARADDSKKAQSYSVLTYENAAKALNVETAVVNDPQQGKDVMSPMLRQQVVAFQKSSQIKANGQLNYRTLTKLSGVTLNEILASAPLAIRSK
ncbi:MAG TPA: hypothetical protein VMW54_15620 [Terriglobia bacterium]|nr:hypothetical protein [Terriglobia bacterium]